MKITDFINKYDSQNQFQVLRNTYSQISDAWNNKIDLSGLKKNNFSSVLFCGLGGSAISGDLLSDYLYGELTIPFYVVRGYNLPSYVNQNTLVIISSYSGNTEETISCLEQALTRKSQIVVITSGGKIEEIASSKKIPVIKIPAGFQPRYALGLSFYSLLKLMQELGFADENKNVTETVNLWKSRSED
jgi:glucose/mannose-6-phosphate isomerase